MRNKPAASVRSPLEAADRRRDRLPRSEGALRRQHDLLLRLLALQEADLLPDSAGIRCCHADQSRCSGSTISSSILGSLISEGTKTLMLRDWRTPSQSGPVCSRLKY